ncbi:pimeloyl-ACP methyl ester carboxylesterase [Kribbella sp. VKM Ac-2527]|jgi:pimeloyl-ACP methyl ester carboxylesterase|uniref:Pimeloyl-ACP methyl ester carboxylesterase n=1 Tax=Kribbella caucasensis TaxID=2512215 RepID=A0A4R6JE40_9ACTN|nr:alpha/beta hydrolase [Kribbella sp. VKM Ac-2527]TDO33862.1 pimeloyl-ACP methyl ester carboxylesterase [Kribbella sp. VKM Ac-2527]
MNTPLLFLSGAGLPAWIWDDVRTVVDRPSTVAEYAKDGSLADCATGVLAAAPERFVVVAHSLGGVVGSQLVAQAPERVEGFFGIAALIPQAGQSFLGALPFRTKLMMSLVMRLAGTRPPASALRSGLAGDLSQELADRIVEDFSPESQSLYRDPVPARTFPASRGYLHTANDPGMPLALQEKFATTLGATWTQTLPTGHLPMLADPKAVGAALTAFLD